MKEKGMNRTRTLCAVAGLVVGGAALGYLAGFGPLDPPGGPVTATSPSLAEISQEIAELGGASGAEDFSTGPWEVFRAPMTGNQSSSLKSQLIAPGRVYVRSITVFYAQAALFDGPGEIDNSGVSRALTDNWIARNSQWFASPGGQLASNEIAVEQIVENGLHVAWRSESAGGYVFVLYRPLEAQP